MACSSFGKLGEYNLVVLGTTTQNNTTIEGRVAVALNAIFNNVTVGGGIVPKPTYGTDDTVIVGGNLTWIGGSNEAGNTISSVSSAIDITDVSYNNASLGIQPILPPLLPINFIDATSYLNCLSVQYSTLASTGNTLVMNCNGNVYLIGDSETLNVFNIDSLLVAPLLNVIGGLGVPNTLTNINGITIVAPEGSTNLINVSGAAPIWGDYPILRSTTVPDPFPTVTTFNCDDYEAGLVPTENQKKKIMWNLYQALTVVMSNINLEGSLLAPKATLSTVGGSIEGSAFVLNMIPAEGIENAHTDLHNYLFDGCFPEVECAVQPNGTVGKEVWFDYNNNGIRDNDEPGVPGVTANIYDCEGNLKDFTITDERGYYIFSYLSEGNYYVQFSNIPENTRFTQSNNVVDVNGKTECFALEDHQLNNLINVPILPIATPINISMNSEGNLYPLSNGTIVKFDVVFTAPDDTNIYNNFTILDTLATGLTFNEAESSVVSSNLGNIDFTSNVNNTTNTVAINFENIENAEEVTVTIAATLTDVTKIPETLNINNFAQLLINNSDIGQSTTNIVTTTFVRQPGRPCQQAAIDVVESIALQQTALAHILNAEGEKIQAVIGTLDGQAVPVATTTDELIRVNTSVENMVNAITLLEGILEKKMQKTLYSIENCEG